MTHYEELDHNIEECAYEGQGPSEAGESFALEMTAEIFDAFTADDWNQLFRELPGKSVMWKRRFSDLLDDTSDPKQAKALEML